MGRMVGVTEVLDGLGFGVGERVGAVDLAGGGEGAAGPELDPETDRDGGVAICLVEIDDGLDNGEGIVGEDLPEGSFLTDVGGLGVGVETDDERVVQSGIDPALADDDAFGLSGVDGGLVRGSVTKPELGFVAGSVEVEPGPLDAVLAAGYVPVISPIGTAGDNAAQLLNVNADTVAGAIAVAIGATHLVFLTDVDGILDAHARLLRRIPLDQAEGLMTSGVVKGGMIPKLEACIHAGSAGISAHIVNGTKPQALISCLDGTVPGTAVA